MKQLILVMAVVLTVGYGIAEGANWVYLTSSEDGNVFYDRESISPSENDNVKVWTRMECTKKDGCRNSNGEYAKSKTQLKINCLGNMLSVEASTLYDDKDLIVEDSYIPVPVMKPVVADTTNELIAKSVCEQK